jgi:transposase InsO family protein
MVGEFKKAPGGFDHLLVAIDKFTKWIEVWPIANLKSERAAKFIQDIIHRFGVPNRIITDNGTQFIGHKLLDFYDSWRIRVDWASVYHPESNGLVECANRQSSRGSKPASTMSSRSTSNNGWTNYPPYSRACGQA